MKKNCSKYDHGGVMTQDSNLDNIPKQKTANFLSFLQATSMAAQQKKFDEQMKAMGTYKAAIGKEVPTDIPEHLDQSRYLRPGATMNESGMRKDGNINAFLGDYYKHNMDWATPANMIGTGVQQMLMQKGDLFRYEAPDGQVHEFFPGANEAGYGDPNLKSFEITGYDKAGKRGRDRMLSYKVTGDQKWLGFPEEDSVGANNTQTPQVKQPSIDLPPAGSPQDAPNSAHGYMNYITNMNKQVQEKMPPKTVINPMTGDNIQLPKMPSKQTQSFLDMIQFAYGGNLPKAQQGSFQPGADVWDPDSLQYGEPPVNSAHGYMDFISNLNQKIGSPSIQETDVDAVEEPGDRELSEEGQLLLKKQSKFSRAMEANPFLASQTALSGMHLLANIGGIDEQAQRERAVRERVSNVHRLYGTSEADRGDYMSNVPGVGDFLKPDQHTRMGYNTKIAQDGVQIDDEVELTEEQINQLIEQGYDLEYLD